MKVVVVAGALFQAKKIKNHFNPLKSQWNHITNPQGEAI